MAETTTSEHLRRNGEGMFYQEPGSDGVACASAGLGDVSPGDGEEIFNDPLKPDSNFLRHLKFHFAGTPLDTWRHVNSALKELSFLKEKKKELEHRKRQIIDRINAKYEPLLGIIVSNFESVSKRIDKFMNDHIFELADDEHRNLIKSLEDFDVVVKTKVIYKPKKTPPDGEKGS